MVTRGLKHSRTQAPKHPSTQARQYSSTPALQHSSTPALQHSSTPAPKYSGTLEPLGSSVKFFRASAQRETCADHEGQFSVEDFVRRAPACLRLRDSV